MKPIRSISPSLVTLVLLLGGCAGHAPRGHAIDSAQSFIMAPDFNGVVLIADGPGAKPFVRAHGVANAEAGIMATEQTRYQVGSISKWLTTLVVLRLVDQNKLTLDVPIGTWLSSLPPETAQRVTLRHLLSNTSGIPNGLMAAFRKDRSIADQPMSTEQAALRFGSEVLQSKPGERWDYSHTNWVLVRAIIEHASGKSFEAVVNEQLIRPLHLTDTGIPTGTGFTDVPHAAVAYKALTPTPQRKMDSVPVYVAASGTFYSTAADLKRVADAVYERSYLSADSRKALSAVQVAEENYALGGRVKVLPLSGRDRQVAWETGAMGGFKTLLVHVPGEGRTVVILNNTDKSQADLNDAAERFLRETYLQ